ncbi:MAG: acyl carrier protein [Treponema sp.]|nr:acyl carrier protein [Treponema sp.]MCR5622771.1 acyl carrier protein [Treponema sp.]
MTKDDLYTKISAILNEEFEIEASKITPQALLMDDLDLDSIDFVDMLSKIREFIPGKIDPEPFKSVRTIQDIVDTLYPYTQAQ